MLPINSPGYDDSKELFVIRPYNGSLYQQGKVLTKKITKPQEGDVVRFDLDHTAHTVSVKINGVDQGVCFTEVPLVPLFPGKVKFL